MIEMDNSSNDFLLYTTEDGQSRLEVRLTGETVWLSLMQLANLFQRDKSVISRHIKNIFTEGELQQDSTVANFATVQQEGSREIQRDIEHYNLDMIISVGYRVKSQRGTQFRIWATERLREYLIKGFTMDDERLKQTNELRYFDELLARIRDIRSSEKVFWRKVLDIYATSIDYDPKNDLSHQFFATIQNKMHWAVHGQTAAELILKRADANQPNMGLTSWDGEQPRQSDTEVAKNYLNEKELEILNRIVTTYLEFAELQALEQRTMSMQQWIDKLDDFLKLAGKKILTHMGNVSHKQALEKVRNEYKQFRLQHINDTSQVERDFNEVAGKIKLLKKDKKGKS